jgi:two-component system nitrate/nitrite response regulator NarL
MPSSDYVIRVVIVAGGRLYRDGVEHLLATIPTVDVVATTHTANDAVGLACRHRASVVLFELTVPGSSQAILALRDLTPSVPVVALSVPETEADVIGCAEAGVQGLVSREGSIVDVIAAIEGAARGETVCSPRTTAILLGRLHALARGPGLDAKRLGRLTSREREIARLIDQGLSNKEISTDLCIELATVKNHVHNILEKLQIRRRVDVGETLRADGAQATLAKF